MAVENPYIAVMSDSHDNLDNVDIAIKLIRERGINRVIHLGDVVSPFTLLRFVSAGLKVILVFGNNDGEKVGLKKIADRNGSEVQDPPYVLVIEGKKILMIHGKGSPEETREYVEALARSGSYDVILYGHTHVIDNRFLKDTLILNPGELFGKISGKASFAILNIRNLDTEIIIL